MLIATFGFAAMLRSLTRPRAVLTRTLSPLASIQTGVTCGEPSGCIVTRCAKAFFSVSRSRNLSGMDATVSPPGGRTLSRPGAAAEPVGERGHRHRAGVAEALHHVAAEAAEELLLGLGLHAFGDQVQAE